MKRWKESGIKFEPLTISTFVALKSSSLSMCVTISKNLQLVVASMELFNWLWIIGEWATFTFTTKKKPKGCKYFVYTYFVVITTFINSNFIMAIFWKSYLVPIIMVKRMQLSNPTCRNHNVQLGASRGGMSRKKRWCRLCSSRRFSYLYN